MPYIAQSERDRPRDDCFTPGRLNYEITQLCAAYVKHKGLNYTHLNDVIGALESAKLELYRRIVSEYENAKIVANGDIDEYQDLVGGISFQQRAAELLDATQPATPSPTSS